MLNISGLKEGFVLDHIQAGRSMDIYFKLGLDKLDRTMLLTAMDKFGGGPVGLGTIATAVSEDTGTIEEVYEPFLIKEGFLKRTPRGREATELAYAHLGIIPPTRQGTLF